VHNQLREAARPCRGARRFLDRFQLDSAAAGIHRDLAVVRPATEQEFAAMRAGRGERADSSRSAPLAPALRDADLALGPVEAVLRSPRRPGAGAESALGRGGADLARGAGRRPHPRGRDRRLAHASISRPVTALEEGMRAVADGELDHKLTYGPTGVTNSVGWRSAFRR